MKKLIALLSLVLTLGLVGCSSKSEVKDIPVSDIKSAINNETLLPIQPIFDIDSCKNIIAYIVINHIYKIMNQTSKINLSSKNH